MRSLHVRVFSPYAGTKSSPAVAPFGQMMQGFSGSVGQQSNSCISLNPHHSDPVSYCLAASMRSPHVLVFPEPHQLPTKSKISSLSVEGSQISAYGAKLSSAVAPFGQMMQGFTGTAKQHSTLDISAFAQSSAPILYSLASSMISLHVVKSPMSVYGV
jgi:hypothetical protein